MDAGAGDGTTASGAATVREAAARSADADADEAAIEVAGVVALLDDSEDAPGAPETAGALGTLITTVTGDGVAAGALDAGAVDEAGGALATTGVPDITCAVGVGGAFGAAGADGATGAAGALAPAASVAHAAASAAAAPDGLPTIGAPTTPVPQEGSG